VGLTWPFPLGVLFFFGKVMGLKGKQQRFCDEYIIDLNATQAAIRAGYSTKTAGVMGFENLTKPKIQQEIARLKEERSERTKIDADWVLEKLALLANANLAKFIVREEGKQPYYDLSQATDEELSILDELTIDTIGSGEDTLVHRIKLKKPSIHKTLELIGKHVDVQAFKEKVESDNKMTVYLSREDLKL